MPGYQPDAWHDFFIGSAGGVAALSGLIIGAGGGLYWLPIAFVIGIMVAAVNAWVLLVEVLR